MTLTPIDILVLIVILWLVIPIVRMAIGTLMPKLAAVPAPDGEAMHHLRNEFNELTLRVMALELDAKHKSDASGASADVQRGLDDGGPVP
jgi:hypothetical protein